MIFSPSVSAGFQSSSLVGASSVTINPLFSQAAFTLKANTPLTVANIVGANPSWADPSAFNDYVTFWADRNYNFSYLSAIYGDIGFGNTWINIITFEECTNTVVPPQYNTVTIQVATSPQTVPLLNGNRAINIVDL
jgi:hypothetical protein